MNLILTILHSVPFFQTLTDEENHEIIEHITEQFYPANYKLFSKGDMGDAMYIIKSGMVKVFDGEKEIASLGDEEFFGEMSLIESVPRNATVETLSDCEIFVLKREDFNKLLEKNPEIAQKVKAAYAARKAENEK
ncbi:cyclic nucleotide-binding domain-containing protein [Patescibacteria group bacterium]|nr:cyclic nucleotide-binding domain-containing protein [Patescibacteria group bacterium]